MCESPSKPLKASATTPSSGNARATTEPPSPQTDASSRRVSNGGIGLVPTTKTNEECVQLATTPPDGGWGWVVVFCSFMVHVLADGVTYSFGIFHLEFLEHFQESNGRTAWVASILVSTTFLCGPLASALTNLYGCRAVTISGAILAAGGLFVSAWAPNVTFLFFSIGVLTGLGLGMMYLPAIVSVAMYFERRRAFATGIAVCGSGFGTFILAPIIEALVNHYGWRGALIITAGMLLQCAVFGTLMRPPEYNLEVVVSNNTDNQGATDPMLGDVDNNTTLYPNENFASSQHQASCKDVRDTVPEIREILETDADDKLLKPGDALGTLHKLGSKDKLHHKSVCHLSVSSEPELVLIRTPSIDRQLYLEREGISYMQANSYASLRKRLSCTSQPSMSIHSVQIREQRNTHEKFTSFVKTIAESIDLALLLRSPVFILFALSNFFTSIGFNVPYVYIKDVARKKLVVEDSKAPLLLSMIGLSNTASRVLLGYLSDKQFVNRITLYNACIGTCGIATALSVFCTNYVQLLLYCLTFGATSGAFISLTSVILVDLLGLEKLNNAFGLVLLFEGVACLIGPPLTGSLYDWTGSYDWGFVFSGVVIALGGVMLCLIPCVRAERKTPTEKEATAVA